MISASIELMAGRYWLIAENIEGGPAVIEILGIDGFHSTEYFESSGDAPHDGALVYTKGSNEPYPLKVSVDELIQTLKGIK